MSGRNVHILKKSFDKWFKTTIYQRIFSCFRAKSGDIRCPVLIFVFRLEWGITEIRQVLIDNRTYVLI